MFELKPLIIIGGWFRLPMSNKSLLSFTEKKQNTISVITSCIVFNYTVENCEFPNLLAGI